MCLATFYDHSIPGSGGGAHEPGQLFYSYQEIKLFSENPLLEGGQNESTCQCNIPSQPPPREHPKIWGNPCPFWKNGKNVIFYLIRCTKAVFLCSSADQGWLAATRKGAKHTQHIPRSVLSHCLWPHQPWERRRSAQGWEMAKFLFSVPVCNSYSCNKPEVYLIAPIKSVWHTS